VVKAVSKSWRSCGVHGKRRAQAYSGGLGAEPLWGPGAKNLVRGSKTNEAGGILTSDAKTKIKTEKINAIKSQMEKIGAGAPQCLH